MRINGLKVKNKSIEINNINMEFEKNGIYIITGDNGCGKTTLLEQVVFGENSVEFTDEYEKELYVNERYKLFTYCPQKIVVNELTVRKYICKENSEVDEEKLKKYMDVFSIEEESLNQKFYTFSGGEQMKASIISGLLKNTPYVFLDEPSNYLDNSSVEALINLLSEESLMRKIIIVSHDKRMYFEEAITYKFQNNTVVKQEMGNIDLYNEVEKTDTKEGEKLCPKVKKPGLRKLIKGLTKNYVYRIVFVIVACLLFGITITTNYGYYVSVGEIESVEEGSMYVQHFGYHSELNSLYEELEGLSVNEKDHETFIGFDDIYHLKELDGINKIYIFDEEYIFNLDCYLGKVPDVSYEKEGAFFVAAPDILYDNYLENCMLAPYLRYIEGKLPSDGSNEIALSKKC